MHDRINPVMKEGKPYCRRATDCRYYTLHRTDGWFCDIIGKPGVEACMPWWWDRVEELERLVIVLKWDHVEGK